MKQIFILSVLVYFGGITATEIYKMPGFLKLPPPVVYYKEGSTLKIKCYPWPQNATVEFMIERVNTKDNLPYMYRLPKHIRVTNESELIIENTKQVSDFKDASLHCTAKTPLGVVLGDHPIRILEAKLGHFLGESSFEETKKFLKLEFLLGNVGVVDCYPPESQPEAQVEFLLNKTLIRSGDKYKMVRWPDGKRVSLLIQSLVFDDQGYYNCRARNPVSDAVIETKKVYYMKVISITKRIQPRIRLHIGGSDQPGPIRVMEGTNLTLFCVMEGGPVPRVSIFKSSNGKSQDPRRLLMDPNFGTLTILNVNENDEGTYSCTTSRMDHPDSDVSSTVTVRVLKHLRIIKGPKNFAHKNSSPARFTCESSDPTVKPLWYHDGKFITSDSSSTDHVIPHVRRFNIGIYQCVLRRDHEWVTASATLADSYLTQVKMPKQHDPNAFRTNQKYSVGTAVTVLCEDEESISPHMVYVWYRVDHSSALSIPFIPILLPSQKFPRVEVKKSRLLIASAEPNDSAYYICEKLDSNALILRKDFKITIGNKNVPGASNKDLEIPAARKARGISKPKGSDENFHIKAQTIYDNLAVLLTWNYTGDLNFTAYKIQYTSCDKSCLDWDEIKTVNAKLPDLRQSRYFFHDPVKPGHMYRFRIHGITGYTSVFTDFSNTVSFKHISSVSPEIKSIDEVDNGFNISWTYYGELSVDNFLILLRRTYPYGSSVSVSKYTVYNVTDPSTRSFLVGDLDSETDYNLVIYGVRNPSDSHSRMITKFSQPKHKRTGRGAYAPSTSIWNNNMLLYYILGGILLLMIGVMVLLLCLCFCRQCKKNKKEAAYQYGYKDPAKMIHREKVKSTNAHSSFMLARIPNESRMSNGHVTSVGGATGGDLSYNRTSSQYGSKQYLDGSAVGGSLMDDHYAQQRLLQQQLSLPINDQNVSMKRGSPSGGSLQDTMKEGYSVKDVSGYRTQQEPNYHQYSSNAQLGSHSNLSHPQHHQYQPYQNGLPSYSSAMMINGEGAIPLHQTAAGNMMMPSVTYLSSGQALSNSGYAPLPMLHHSLLPQGRRPSQLDMSGGGEGLSPRNADSESVYSFRSQQDYPQNGMPFMTSSDQPHYSNTISGDSQSKSQHRRRRRPKGNQDPNVLPEGVVAIHEYQNSNDSLPQPFAYNQMQHQMSNNSDMSNPRDLAIAPVSGLPASLSHRSLQMIGGGPSQYAGYPQQPQQHFESNSTLTRRGTPTLFNEPPKVRDYSEYGIPLMPTNHSPVPTAYPQQYRVSNAHHHSNSRLATPPLSAGYREAQA